MTAVRALGLDLGTTKIGVAVSDELGLAAHPRLVLPRRGDQADAEAVAALVAEEGAQTVVVGLPLTLEGKVGPAARKALAFVEVLRRRLSVPVETWDERFSTAAVERVLLQGDVSRKKRKQVIDKQAAAFLLQGWLDARRGPG
jgi:putative Holliday junction resolvase